MSRNLEIRNLALVIIRTLFLYPEKNPYSFICYSLSIILNIFLCVENNNMFIQNFLRNVLAILSYILSVVIDNEGYIDLIVDFDGVYLYTDITHARAYYRL